jgi:glutamate racemase
MKNSYNKAPFAAIFVVSLLHKFVEPKLDKLTVGCKNTVVTIAFEVAEQPLTVPIVVTVCPLVKVEVVNVAVALAGP